MSKLTLDAETLAKLNGLSKTTEIYNEQGQLVAVMMSPRAYRAMHGPSAFGPFTEEELREADQATGPGRLLEDILADLRAGR
jgi:hypothetical protein